MKRRGGKHLKKIAPKKYIISRKRMPVGKNCGKGSCWKDELMVHYQRSHLNKAIFLRKLIMENEEYIYFIRN